MEYLNNYKIERLEEKDLEGYTEKLVNAFEIPQCYNLYLVDNRNNYKRGNIFLGAILNNLLIGGISFENKPIYKNEIYIENLFVNKEYRYQGVASNLIEYIVENKLDLFNRTKIELYLFCQSYLESFYNKEKFVLEDYYQGSTEKVLRMKRNI